MADPLVSVIIPTYERPRDLARCLASLAGLDFPRTRYEVLVVNDGGDVAHVEAAAARWVSRCRLSLIHQANLGPGPARSAGLRRAEGTILVFLDDDCTVPRDFLRRIERVFRGLHQPTAVQVCLDNPDPANIYGRAWKYIFDTTMAVPYAAAGGRLEPGILGGVMVAHRDVFRGLAFDARFRTRQDIDFRLQLQEKNRPVLYAPELVVYHHGRTTLRQFLRQYYRYGRYQGLLQEKWRGRSVPFRYPSFTSVADLRRLVRANGLPVGMKVYGLLWLKKLAGRAGRLSGFLGHGVP
jgi:GT2 family glycosyltransferase